MTTRLGSAAVRVCAVAALVIVAAVTLNATNGTLSAAATILSRNWFGRILAALPVLSSLAGLVLLGWVWRGTRRRRAKGDSELELVKARGLPGPLALAVAAADAGLLVLLLWDRSPAGTGVAVLSLLLGVYWADAEQLTRVVAVSLLMFLSLLLAGEHAMGEPAHLVPAAAVSGASVETGD